MVTTGERVATVRFIVADVRTKFGADGKEQRVRRMTKNLCTSVLVHLTRLEARKKG